MSRSCPTTPVKANKENDEIRNNTLTPKRITRTALAVEPNFEAKALFATNHFGKTGIVLRAATKRGYKVFNLATGTLGGNGSSGAIYGELTQGSMQKNVNYLKDKCGLDKDSRFLDVGAGLGKPNMHVAQDVGVRLSIGVELEPVRHQVSCATVDVYKCSMKFQLSMVNLQAVLNCSEGELNGHVNFQLGDITGASTLVREILL